MSPRETPDRTRRKVRKLLRDPNRFFFDFFSKRVDPTLNGARADILTAEESATGALLRRDFITDLTPQYERLIYVLTEHAGAIQEMESDLPHRRRLAVKSIDMGYLVGVMKEIDLSPYKLSFTQELLAGDDREITVVRFCDDELEYQLPTIELDPWQSRNGLIESFHRNKFVSVLDEQYANRTVWFVTPPYLCGEQEKNISFSEAVGVDATVTGVAPFPVDIVYTWVDDSDPAWRDRKSRHYAETFVRGRNSDDFSVARYRNRDELRYSLRSVASCFREVRNIYIVTDQQRPFWMDVDHPRIHLVDHRDIFEDGSHLPTFNSHAIESNLFRIDGLSEHFLYLNDDFFFLNPCNKLDFFHCNGISKSFFEARATAYGQASPEWAGFKNGALNGSELLRKAYGRSAHSYHRHTPFAVRRSVMQAMWERFPQELEHTSAARFRSVTDLSPISFLYHYFAVLEAKAVPSDISGAYVKLGSRHLASDLAGLVLDRESKVLCVNDTDVKPANEARVDAELQAFFERIFPVPAEWEIDR